MPQNAIIWCEYEKGMRASLLRRDTHTLAKRFRPHLVPVEHEVVELFARASTDRHYYY